MKKTKEQLQKEIEAIERQEALVNKKLELQRMKQVVGKGWCTHSVSTYMTKGRASYEFHAFFVDGAKMDEDREPVYILRTVTVIKADDVFKFTTEKTSYHSDLPFYLGSFRYEIDNKNFTKIYEEAVAVMEKGIDHIRNEQPIGYKVSQGDHHNAGQAKGWLQEEGYEFINMEQEEPLAFQMLRWKNHPFLYNAQLLNSEESFKIAQNIAETTYRESSKWGGSIIERDRPRIEALYRFIKKYQK